jgi:predicted permease
VLRRWLNLFRRDRLEEELREELEFHRSQTQGSFGNMTKVQEEAREASTVAWLETLCQDVRIACRMLARSRIQSAVALTSIALSIAATSIVFAAVKAVLLDPLPYPKIDRIVQLRSDSPQAPSHSDWLFPNDAQEIARRTQTLDSVAVYGNAVFNLAGDTNEPPLALYGLQVSANLFPTLGVAPMLGRNISVEEDRPGQPREVILSYGIWSSRFHKDPKVIGQRLHVNGGDCLVIGVMAKGFDFPLVRGATRVPTRYVAFWTPMRMNRYTKPNQGAVQAIARLRNGVTVLQAQQDLNRISKELAHEYPNENRDRELKLGMFTDRMVKNVKKPLWIALAATLLFLLISSTNVATLLLARGAGRRREISIRMAIGAGRARIVRQLLTESMVLSLIGGACGYCLSIAAWKLLAADMPASVPRLDATRADPVVLMFAVATALATGLFFGIFPALRCAQQREPGLGAQNASIQRRDRTRGALVFAEVTTAMLLVLLGSKLLDSFVALLKTDLGFDQSVLAAVVLPPPERYRTPAEHANVYRRFLNAVRTMPGVKLAGTVDALPFSGENHGSFLSVDGGNQTVAEANLIGGDYLQAMGAVLKSGRWFQQDSSDDESQSVLINEDVAKRFWPASSGVGERLCIDCTPEHPNNWKHVIGVVSTMKHADVEAPVNGSIYLRSQALSAAAFLVIKTDRPPEEMKRAMQQAIASVDHDQPILLSATMADLVSDTLAARRFLTSLLTGLGALALTMALAGIYGVTSFTVAGRTQEIGIRIAVGATQGRVVRVIFQQGFVSVGAGIAAGSALAIVLQHIARSMMQGLEGGLAGGMAVAGSLVVLSSMAAFWIPARRAAKMQPTTALRAE